MSSKAKKKSNKKIIISKTAIIVFVAVCMLTILFGFLFKSPIEKLLNANQLSTSDLSKIDNAGLTIHFVDVGQGDCIAIRFPDGKTMLIDAGPSESKNQMINYLDNNFFDKNEKTFDWLLLTHSDADHCGGMVEICNKYNINKIYRPMIYYNYNGQKENTDKVSPKYCETLAYYKTIKAFENETDEESIVFCDMTECNNEQKIFGEGYYFEFYSPTKTTKSVSYNDFSPIMVLNYNGKKIMFTGDASTDGVENLVLDNLPDVDLLKVGHHGSKYSTSDDFLAKTSPEIAVIQCGKDNDYGHPHSETIDRLEYINAKIYRNDLGVNILANVTKTDGQIDIYFIKSGEYLIRIEYLISGVILVSAYFCFGIKPKKTNKK